jgi:AcrR family transcriptional regulator
MTAAPAKGSVRKLSEKRTAAYVAAARDSFFSHGFAGTTMSSIASRIGGSKTTLWTYFPSKDRLFEAVVDDIVQLHAKALSVALPLDLPVEAVLHNFGVALLDSIYSPQILALHRLVAGEAVRFPHLATLFYERGPARGKARLVAYLGSKMRDGSLRSGDPALAGRQFGGLCQGTQFHSVLFGMAAVPDKSARDAEVQAAVDSFCRAWAP